MPEFVFCRKDVSPNAKLFYMHILNLTRSDGYCYEQNSYFEKYHNKSKSSIKQYLKELRENGFVDVEIEYKDDTKEVSLRKIKILCGII